VQIQLIVDEVHQVELISDHQANLVVEPGVEVAWVEPLAVVGGDDWAAAQLAVAWVLVSAVAV